MGSSLAPLLQDLDRAGDPGQRVAQLVGGVGDEVGFGELAAHLVGAVADDGEDGALVGQGAGLHRVGAVADAQRRVGGEADLGRAAQLGQHRLRRAPAFEQLRGGAVGEAHRPLVVDDHHRVVEAVEDRLELVAVGGEHAEALLQRGAHRLQGAGEVADLVRPGDLERSVEAPRRHFARGLGEAQDSARDRGRDQEAGEDADQQGDDQGAPVFAEEVDGEGGDQRDDCESAAQPQPASRSCA